MHFITPILFSMFLCSCASLIAPKAIKTNHTTLNSSVGLLSELQFSLEGGHGSDWTLELVLYPLSKNGEVMPLGSTSLLIKGQLEIFNKGDRQIEFPERYGLGVKNVTNPVYLNPSESAYFNFILEDAPLKNLVKIRLGEGLGVDSLDYRVLIDLEPPTLDIDWNIDVFTRDFPATL